MLLSPSRRLRTVLRSLAAAALAAPLVAADCTDLTTSPAGAGGSYDGTYTLVSVNGQSLPYNIIYVDSQNRLVLTRGEWTISGSSLTTRMWTTSYVNGVAEREARFNPEVHTCSVTISDDRAQCTLDSGTPIYATIDGGTIVHDNSGNSLRFER